ncbi:MAG: type II secretion system protein GspJ [Polyangiaceae bacterium]
MTATALCASSAGQHASPCGGRVRRAERIGRRARRASEAGLTLIEVLISVTILALVASLIYGAFDGMSRSRQGLGRINDRYHQGRSALSRMSRELQSAFISAHQPLVLNQAVRNTVFWGKDSSTTDRIDFNSFSHRRLSRDAHESDQNELSYFVSRDPEAPGQKMDLVRRESALLDLEPDKGGVIQVLCEDIESFDVQYLDQSTGEWTDTWDSSQPAAQYGRLPLQVRITLLLRGGIGDQPIKLTTKIPLTMQAPLSFALTDPVATGSSTSSSTTGSTSTGGGTTGGTSGAGSTSGGPLRPQTTRPKP